MDTELTQDQKEAQDAAVKFQDCLNSHNCRLEAGMVIGRSGTQSIVNVTANTVAGEDQEASVDRAKVCQDAMRKVCEETGFDWSAICYVSSGSVRVNLELVKSAKEGW